jgi:hypothetical protein
MALTYTINTEVGQSIWDIAVQEYGDVSAVWLLLQDNEIIADLNTILPPGTELIIRQNPIVADAELMNFFRNNKIVVNASM